MTDRLLKIAETKRERVKAGVARRRGKEKRFRFYGIASISMAFAFLIVLMTTIVGEGYTAFFTTEIELKVDLSAEALGIDSDETNPQVLMQASYRKVLRKALLELCQLKDASKNASFTASFPMARNTTYVTA